MRQKDRICFVIDSMMLFCHWLRYQLLLNSVLLSTIYFELVWNRLIRIFNRNWPNKLGMWRRITIRINFCLLVSIVGIWWLLSQFRRNSDSGKGECKSEEKVVIQRLCSMKCRISRIWSRDKLRLRNVKRKKNVRN